MQIRPGRIFAIITFFWLSSCAEETAEAPANEIASIPAIVEVTAIYEPDTDRHLFDTDVKAVPAGWTTFRLINASPVVHFIFLDHLPEARTSADLMSEISPLFQQVADEVRGGKTVEEASAILSGLPDWFSDVVFRGGTGYLSPGEVSEATLYLEPGNYVMECYIKTADGTYHWNRGMYLDLLVTDDPNAAQPPDDPSIKITVTDDGLKVEGEPTAGDHLIEVQFQQQTAGLVANDVHLARLDKTGDPKIVARWMDFFLPDGGVSTTENPAPALFLGGVHEMPLGNTAYFPVTLEPGRYMWVSEQPLSNANYVEFTVSEDRSN